MKSTICVPSSRGGARPLPDPPSSFMNCARLRRHGRGRILGCGPSGWTEVGLSRRTFPSTGVASRGQVRPWRCCKGVGGGCLGHAGGRSGWRGRGGAPGRRVTMGRVRSRRRPACGSGGSSLTQMRCPSGLWTRSTPASHRWHASRVRPVTPAPWRWAMSWTMNQADGVVAGQTRAGSAGRGLARH